MVEDKDSLLTFPTDFPIKVFGISNEEFVPLVLEIIRNRIPDLHETAIRTRPSKDNKYLSVTILVHVGSKEELDNIYRDLTANPLILMAL